MRRGRERAEDGVAAVLVTILMVTLLTFASFGIDLAMLVSERAQLASAADSTAMQIARYCALHFDSQCQSTSASLTVGQYQPGATATQSPAAPNWQTDSSITVKATQTVATPLRKALGLGSTQTNITVGASWSYVASSGTPVVPFGIDWCTWSALQPGTYTGSPAKPNRGVQTTFGLGVTMSGRQLSQGECTGAPTTTGATSTGYSGNLGGYVLYLYDSVSKSCGLTTDLSRIPSNGIVDALGEQCVDDMFKGLSIGQTAFVPIYSVAVANGSDTWAQLQDNASPVTILGYAPIYIDGFVDNTGNQLSTCSIASGCRGIEGYFVITTRAFNGWTYASAPGSSLNFGAVRVTRTQ